MKKRNEETIIKILHEAVGKSTIRDIRRRHQITEQTFYRWRNTIFDEYTRVSLAIPCGRSMTGGHVIRILLTLIQTLGGFTCTISTNPVDEPILFRKIDINPPWSIRINGY